MKTILYTLIPLMAVAGGIFFSGAEAEGELGAVPGKHKVLIVYYSRTGQNYVAGDIVNLPVGNTAAVAEIIREKTGADVFEIRTVKPYPADYHETTEVAKKELHEQARPEIVSGVDHISQYDTIILGYPNWWGTMPMAVRSFLDKHDLSGKCILPFCTHEGSGMGRSVRDLKDALPESTIKSGLAIKGSRVHRGDRDIPAEVETWLKKNL